MSRPISRRLILGSAAALPLIQATSARAADQITILIWGTTWQLVVKEIADKFTAATGIGINLTTQTTGGESLIKLQAMKADPTVDVWFTTSSVAERAVKDGDLFADLPTAEIPNLAQVEPGAKTPRWVGAYGYPLGIVYRPDLVKAPITQWEDLWNPAFANQIGAPAPSSYQGRMLLIAALLAGGSIDNVDPGFAKLKAWKNNVAFWYTSDAQARKALAQGEIAVLIAPAQRRQSRPRPGRHRQDDLPQTRPRDVRRHDPGEDQEAGPRRQIHRLHAQRRIPGPHRLQHAERAGQPPRRRPLRSRRPTPQTRGRFRLLRRGRGERPYRCLVRQIQTGGSLDTQMTPPNSNYALLLDGLFKKLR